MAGRPVKMPQARTNIANKKAAFLRAFEKYGSISISARFAGIDRTTHYEWVAKDLKYKAEFEMRERMAADAIQDELARLVVKGDFRPHIRRGKYCFEPRIRTICQLADGTSAFRDELPKGAKVTASREVTVHDGAMIGRTRHSPQALAKLLSIMQPEEYGKARRRVGKPPAR